MHRSSAQMASDLVSSLASAGAKLLFGIPGGGSNLDVVGAAERAGLRFVLAHTETAAAIMAGVVAELTGAPSACLVTRGPGVANALNGVAQALLDRQPIIVISDCVQEAQRERVSHQRIEQQKLMSSITKASLRYGPRDAHVPALAVELALAGCPGPVHLDFDPTSTSPGTVPIVEREAGSPLEKVADLLRGSRRPVIVAGVGTTALPAARRGPLAAGLARLFETNHIPTLTTYKARGVIPDKNMNAAGVATGATAESALLHAADLIIGFGLDPVELIPAPWPYEAPVVLFGSWVIDDSTYFGDKLAGQAVGDLTLLVDAVAGLVVSTWASGEAQRYRERALDSIQAAVPRDAAGLTPQEVVNIARAAAPAGTTATIDAGAHMLAAVPLWEVDAPGQLLISNGLATMGFALPAAIAAALVDPSRHVVCFTGDGGLGMALAELETVARLNLPVTVVVFNDSMLSLIAIKQNADGHGGPAAVSYAPTDFATIATGFGIRSETVARTDTYHDAFAKSLTHDGPTLLDVTVDPSAYQAILTAVRGDRRDTGD